MKNSLLRRKLFICALCLCFALVFSACSSGEDQEENLIGSVITEGQELYGEKTTLEGFWDTCACYSLLGQEATAEKTFEFSSDEENQPGVSVLCILMMGGDPYDYNGTDYVAILEESGTEGAFSVPVFNFLAWQALGEELDAETEAGFVDACINQATELSMGPDTGGWALVSLVAYYDNPDYHDAIKEAADTYFAAVSDDMMCNSMGSAGLTYCGVITGLCALDAMGYEGCDVLTDEPWVTIDPLSVMADNLRNGEENVSDYYNAQYYLTFADVARVFQSGELPTWLSIGR